MDQKKLPKNLESNKKKIHFTNEGLLNSQDVDYAGAFANLNFDNSKSVEDFMQQLDIKILSMNQTDMTFEIKGIEAPIANALRRIIISEIPTMAIEKVIMWQNTSVIHDEVLCHRLGLVPIQVDPRMFTFKKESDEDNETNCVLFKLHVKCDRKKQYKNADKKTIEKLSPEELYENTIVYADQLEWVPIGNQAELFKDNPPRPVHDKVIIAKLRGNQEIECELKCEKGKGKLHAKWSPVATAFYRLMPDIEITKDIVGEDAEELVQTCPMNVYGLADIEDIGSKGSKKKGKKAVVENAFDCTMCRECIRNEKFTTSIDLGKERNHYIFTIEAVGMLSPADIFKESLKILKEKCLHHFSFFEEKKGK